MKPLTSREVMLVALFKDGQSVKEVAQVAGLLPRTIERILRRALKRQHAGRIS